MTTATRPEITTLANLEAAFAGESMAHIKYRYFARLARAAGDEDTALVFEETAAQEVMHAFGHLDLLYPKASLTPAAALQIAIDGETYEYSDADKTNDEDDQQNQHANRTKKSVERDEAKTHHVDHSFPGSISKSQAPITIACSPIICPLALVSQVG